MALQKTCRENGRFRDHPGLLRFWYVCLNAPNGEWTGRWYELILQSGTGSFSEDQLHVRELQTAPVPEQK
jgi:hypothetical protein